MFWNVPDWFDFDTFWQKITSPWLKKILKFEDLKCFRLIWFLYFLTIIISPWLKKILKFDVLKRSRLAGFCCNFRLLNFACHEILHTVCTPHAISCWCTWISSWQGATADGILSLHTKFTDQNGRAHGRLSPDLPSIPNWLKIHSEHTTR